MGMLLKIIVLLPENRNHMTSISQPFQRFASTSIGDRFTVITLNCQNSVIFLSQRLKKPKASVERSEV